MSVERKFLLSVLVLYAMGSVGAYAQLDADALLKIYSANVERLTNYSVAFEYKSKPTPEMDRYFKDLNIIQREMTKDAVALNNEHYSERFTGYEWHYDCELHAQEPRYKLHVTGQAAGDDQIYGSDGKICWVLSASTKQASIRNENKLSWPPLYPNYVLGFPRSITSRDTGICPLEHLTDLVRQADPKNVKLKVLDGGIVELLIYTANKASVLHNSYIRRKLTLDPSKSFAVTSYTVGGAIIQGDIVTPLSINMSEEYKDFVEVMPNLWLPKAININEYASLPAVKTMTAYKTLPWLPDQAERYLLRRHEISVSQLRVETPEHASDFSLNVSNLPLGARVFDELSGKQYVVGDSVNTLKEKIEKSAR